MHPLDKAGRRLDTRWRRLGLVLTQGGEPTFVAAYPTAAEWNHAALGPEKLPLTRRLAAAWLRTHPGAVVILTPGKLYPGEPEPRWTLHGLRWEQPLWRRPALLAPERAAAVTPQAELLPRLLEGLGRRLGWATVPLPAVEDLGALLRAGQWTEAAIPLPRFSPSRMRYLAGPRLNRRQRAAIAPWLGTRGWVLPVPNPVVEDPVHPHPWAPWFPREIALVPGAQSIGLRLPVHRLPEGIPMNAVTAEWTTGGLVLCLPVLATPELMALLRGLEAELRRLRVGGVLLEAPAVPEDAGLRRVGFACDPGVVEVNLPAAEDFTELAAEVRAVYAAAEQVGLRGDRFHYPGRHTGTGGGSHVLVGGRDAASHPFLQRPHLLPSLIRFCQNHPSLSYVFNGQFVGPSSQAPRVDESAPGLPDELALAMQRLARWTGPVPAKVLDGLFRPLLLDWQGNQHRAEICLDKFANPGVPNGCLGVVELRAVESQPTANALLAVHLLFRALVTVLAEHPYERSFRHWGEELTDVCCLPSWLWRDLGQVLDYLAHRGVPLARSWYRPLWDWRFPRLHHVANRRWKLELRQALEPWAVIGDGGGTARLVDASTDRLELQLRTATGGTAWEVRLNGYPVPFQPLGNGARVVGIRFRAFTNPHGRLPDLPAQSPLVFEVVHRPTRRVDHAFAYHTWHPGQMHYEGLPRDEAEAARRRRERVVILSAGGAATPLARGGQRPTMAPASRFTFDLRSL